MSSVPLQKPDNSRQAAQSPTPGPQPLAALNRALQGLTRDKADALLLLLSAVMVLAPHAAHLPLWISLVAAATLVWRATITLRGTRLPPLWLLLPVALSAMGGVYLSFNTLLGKDAGVAMLALLLAFKLLEMQARRDLFVVVFLSYFLLLSNFLYSQTIATAAMLIATIIVLLTAQVSFQYTGVVPSLARRLRLSASIFVISVPLALLLFVVFPRIQGPLWGMPSDTAGGRTGLSDTMAPGTLSNLAQSNEPAFRVLFQGAPPPQNKLYWRGVVLGNYDGRTWTRVDASREPAARLTYAPVNIELLGQPIRYQVTLEPHGRRWLYALELPERVNRRFRNPSTVSPEMEFLALNPVSERLRYDVSSVLEYTLQSDLSPQQLAPWLALPAGYNPRALAWAAKLRKPGDAPASVNAVLHAFREESFRYTLQPPLLGRNAVDDFLFNSKAGFCEHYAGAFVVLMRAMGIPARVVTGYQGGELNPIDHFVTVKQSDAHAWAEVWLAGRGWKRVDPTAAVDPARVESSQARAAPPSSFGMPALSQLWDLGGGENGWLPRLRFKLAAIDNAWNQWVLDYNPERQRTFLQSLSSSTLTWRSALVAAVLAALFIAWRVIRARPRLAPEDALYLAFCRQQAKRGYSRAPDEGPQRYAARLESLPLAPEKKAAILRFLAIYGSIKYGKDSAPARAGALLTMKRLLTESR
jgi:transglutaminase-like putative cysteine protease